MPVYLKRAINVKYLLKSENYIDDNVYDNVTLREHVVGSVLSGLCASLS